MALRKPTRQNAIPLDLTKALDVIVITSEILKHPPRRDMIFIELSGLDKWPVRAQFRDGVRQSALYKPVTVQLDKVNEADLPEVHVELAPPGRANKSGLAIKVSPVIVTREGVLELTKAKVRDVRADLDRSRKELRDTETAVAKLKTQLGAYERQPTKAPGAVGETMEKIQSGQRTADQIRQRIRSLELGIPPVEKLVNALHNVAKIDYRLFVRLDEVEVDLVDTRD
jgi:hypothetical protein